MLSGVRKAVRWPIVAIVVVSSSACGAFSSTPAGPTDAATEGVDGAVAVDAASPDGATVDAATSRFCAPGKHLFCDDFELSNIPADLGPWSDARRSGAGQFEVLDAVACGGSRCLRAFSSGLQGTAMLRVSLPLQPTLCRFRIKVAAPAGGTTAKVVVVSSTASVRASESKLELVGAASVALGPTPSDWTEVVLGLQTSNTVSVQANITGGAPGGANPTLSDPVVVEVGVESSTTDAWSVLFDDFYCDKL